MKYQIEEYVIIEYDEEYSYIFLKRRKGKNSRIIRLNSMGKRILELLKENKTVEEISHQIIKICKETLDEKEILKDIQSFLVSLETLGIIKRANSMESGVNQNITSSKSNYSFTQELGKIQEKYHKEGKPYKVFVELTYQCNLRCKHCYRQEHVYNNIQTHDFLQKERVLELFDELEKIGIIEVFLTGGEPFLHPDIFEILEYGAKKNFLLSVFTNGNVLSELQNVIRIKNLPLYDIRVSVYGGTEHHDSITGVKGSCEKSHKALELLNEHMGIGTGVFVLTKDNFNDYVNIVEEFKNKKIKLSINPILLPTSEGGMEPTEMRISNKQYRKFLEDIEVPLYGSKCSAGMSKFRVTATGEINPCEYMEEWVFGNIYNDKFDEVLFSKRRQEFLEYFMPIIRDHSCNSCKIRNMCNFCPAIFKIEMGDYNLPSKYICEITKEKVAFMELNKKEYKIIDE